MSSVINVLADALTNLDPKVGTDPDYARGVLVGAIAAVMQFKLCGFEEAVVMVQPHLPPRIDPLAVPSGWSDLVRLVPSNEERRK